MDKLQSMQALVNVVNAGTYTRAADLMNLPISTLTRLIQGLEAELKIRLLHRTSRKLALTAEGQAYYEGAIRVLEAVAALESDVTSASGKPHGKVRVEMAGSAAYHLVVPRLPEFFAAWPDIEVELAVGNRAVDLIAENVDCVVRLGPLMTDTLVARPAGWFDLLACASPEYLERHGTPASPEDIARDHTLIRMASPSTGRQFDYTLGRGERSVTLAGRHNLTVNDSTAAVQAAACGLGVLVTYGFMVRAGVAAGRLVALLPDWECERVAVHVAYPANRHLTHKVRVFVDWLIEVFREQTMADAAWSGR